MSRLPLGALWRAFRSPNLLVVALTQGLVYFKVLRPALDAAGLEGVLTLWKLTELVLATVFITASGYLVNDLHDERIDRVNRPGTNPVERLGRPTVAWLYAGCVLGGYLLSLLLAFRLNERVLLWIYPLAVGTLAVYSTSFKRIPALGNLLVAAYCAGVPGVILLAERAAVRSLFALDAAAGQSVIRIVALFMGFAFIATLLRELVKDLEDLRGDRDGGRHTLPVLLGTPASRALALALGAVVILAILSPVLLGWPAFLTTPLLICIGGLVLALTYCLFRLVRAREPRDYHRVSTQLKLVLLLGLGLLVCY